MRLILTPVAENDLQRIYIFNLRRTWQWADKVEERLLESMARLRKGPDPGRPLNDEGVKRLSITDIQYVIDYELTDDGVRILRVRHTREIR